MTMLKIYKSRKPNIAYIFKNGKVCPFVRRTGENVGQYLTSDPDEVKELDAEAKKHPFIYVDASESEVDEKLADPAVAYRAQVEAEVRAQIMAELGDQNQPRLATSLVDKDGTSFSDPTVATGQKEKDSMGETDAKSQLGGISNSTTVLPTDPVPPAGSTGTASALAALKAKQGTDTADKATDPVPPAK